jgi:predicted ribosomally synthesized peptide with SipW-like signal peptide
MRKVGLIALALILALGSLGVGYAMWSDTVTINGTVNTGNVDLDIVEVSCTHVYKVIDDIVGGDLDGEVVGNMIVDPSCTPLAEEQDADPDDVDDLLLVASAVTSSCMGDTDYAEMTFTNIFPTAVGNEIEADIVLHYDGTIPAHIVYTEDDSGLGLLAQYQEEKWLYMKNIGTPENPSYGDPEEIDDPDDLQLHKSDKLKYIKYFDLPQTDVDPTNATMGLSGTFLITIEAQQWNE